MIGCICDRSGEWLVDLVMTGLISSVILPPLCIQVLSDGKRCSSGEGNLPVQAGVVSECTDGWDPGFSSVKMANSSEL